MSATTRFGPDEQALLEEERDFLLRSLDDLERERSEGSLTDDDHQRLRDDYTARAASVIRAIRDGVDARPVAAPVPAFRRFVAVGGIVVFAVVAALLLGRALGERLPGETVTGNEQLRPDAGSATETLEALAAASEKDPHDTAARVAYADALLDTGRAAEALRQYDEAAKRDPRAAEARVKSAFIVFNAGLVDEALARLDQAEQADPSYPDTSFVRGIVLLRGRTDRVAAEQAFARYLEVAPEGAYAQDARVVLQELQGEPTEGTP